jgi:hypothetical protein
MSTVPLPERPSLEHLRKQAKALRRNVLVGAEDALALVAEHHPDAQAMFTLDAAQLVIARRYGFPSWARLRQAIEPPTVGSPEDVYHARPRWASDTDLARVGAPHWRPLITVHRNGVRLVAFATPDGPLFCELTPTTVTVSPPGAALFHTALGSLAGVVPPGVRTLSLARPGQERTTGRALVIDGLFLLPNGFTITDAGLRFGHEIVTTVPRQAVGTTDRPLPPVDQTSPAGRRLAAYLAAADAPPVVDPDQWVPGAYTEQGQLGRYGNLLAYCLLGEPRTPHVTDLDHARIRGTTIAATGTHYDFRRRPGHGMGSDSIAVLGAVHDDRVTTITLTRPASPDTAAVLADGTFILYRSSTAECPRRRPPGHVPDGPRRVWRGPGNRALPARHRPPNTTGPPSRGLSQPCNVHDERCMRDRSME